MAPLFIKCFFWKGHLLVGSLVDRAAAAPYCLVLYGATEPDTNELKAGGWLAGNGSTGTKIEQAHLTGNSKGWLDPLPP